MGTFFDEIFILSFSPDEGIFIWTIAPRSPTQLRCLKGVQISPLLRLKPLLHKDYKGGTFYDEIFILSIFEKYKPNLLVACAKAGLRLYLYRVAGYEVKVEQPKTPQTYLEALKELVAATEKLEALQRAGYKGGNFYDEIAR